jgi:uncharacterized membrane protein YgcG
MMRLFFGLISLLLLSIAHALPANGLLAGQSQQVISVKGVQLLQLPVTALTAETEQNEVSSGGAKSEMVRSKASVPKNSTSSFFWLVAIAVFVVPLIAIIFFAYFVFRLIKSGARATSGSADSDSNSTFFSSSSSFDSRNSSDSGSSDSGGSSDGGGSSSSWD